MLHLVHMLDFPGLDVIGASVDPPTQLWIVARGITAVTFVVAPFVLGHRLPVRRIALALVAVDALALMSIYWWDVFPSAYSLPEGLTTFKMVGEYVICALFALAIVLLWQRRRRLPGDGFVLLVGSLGAGIAAELLFTLYVGPHTWPNHLGHLFLVLSAILVYLALVEDTLARPHTLAVESLREARRLHERLERSLLPTLPASHPGLAVIAHYQPGEHHLELGGDFIDVVELERGGGGDLRRRERPRPRRRRPRRHAARELEGAGAERRRRAHDRRQTLREIVAASGGTRRRIATVCLALIEPGPSEMKLLTLGHPPPLLIDETSTPGRDGAAAAHRHRRPAGGGAGHACR